MFLKAVALCRQGRIGKVQRVTVAIGGAPKGGPFEKTTPPPELDWNMWLGQTPKVDYIKQRCHADFRWWYEYSGGKMTDWGAHHIDITQLALGHENTGPVKVTLDEPTTFTPIVPEHFNWHDYLAGTAKLPNGYHTATKFAVKMHYVDGSTMTIHDYYTSPDGKTTFPNGILFTGENGRIFVNRERLTGKPVEDMTAAQRTEMLQALIPIYKGRWPGDHMGNFFDCVEDRGEPISDVASHHRTMTCCHLANIAQMLGRELHWNPDAEKFVDDPQAEAFTSRHRRDEYSLAATT
jgi:predicted dehydrogenase